MPGGPSMNPKPTKVWGLSSSNLRSKAGSAAHHLEAAKNPQLSAHREHSGEALTPYP